MINGTSRARAGYYLDDVADGMTLVRRDPSGACVGRLYRAEPDPGSDLWLAELGLLRVMTPYPSRDAAVAAICAFADENPDDLIL
jgi:hypothetical protein